MNSPADYAEIAAHLPNEDPLRPPSGKKNAPSFLFEIKVLLDMLSALKRAGWTIAVERRSGRIRLVRGPAPKSTGSFFRITRAESTFQITQGTQVKDRHGEPRAPDICLLLGSAGEQPTFCDVLALWDAKLRGKTGRITEDRISDGEFRSFAMVRSWLAPPLPSGDHLAGWPPAFSVCALISNGRRPTEPIGVLFEAGVSVVEQYAGANTSAWPSRQDHINARPPPRS